MGGGGVGGGILGGQTAWLAILWYWLYKHDSPHWIIKTDHSDIHDLSKLS